MQVLEKKVLFVESVIARLQGGGVVESRRHKFKIILAYGVYNLIPLPGANFQAQKFDVAQLRAFLHMVRKQVPEIRH
jgi:hypothetical protein